VKVFIDSNVLIAALRGSALCRQLLFQVQEATRQELYISDTVLSETARILRYKMGVPPEVIAAQLAQVAELLNVSHKAVEPVPCSDLDDGWVLADAVQTGADYFVTGDKVLLAMYTVQSMRIVTPRELMDQVYRGIPIARFEAHEESAVYPIHPAI
jgi:putative PIN family toxin of toxin-antitoxin system